MKLVNIGIVAHVDAGKTTVTENLLYLAGVITKIGKVDTGNTQTDAMELERRRGISIKSSPISFSWKNTKVNIIDTPGHVDFISEVERSLSVLDGAILVISAKEGIQSQTRVLFDTLQSLKIPTIIFINKVDRAGVDCQALLEELQTTLSDKIVVVNKAYAQGGRNVYLGELFEDSIQEGVLNILGDLDAEVFAAFVNDKQLPKELIEKKVGYYTQRSQLYPALCGSALLELGVDSLLNSIVNWLPASKPAHEEPLSGVVFKIKRKDLKEKGVFVRLYQGSVGVRQKVAVSGDEVAEKVTKIIALREGNQAEVDSISAGDIGILYGVDSLEIGDVIGEACEAVHKISLATPTLKVRIAPSNAEDRHKLYQILTVLAEEDPLLDLEIGGLANDIFINLFGVIQMEILESILKESYSLDIEFSEATTIYKETPSSKGAARTEIYSRGNIFAAGVGIEIEPLNRGEGVQYVTDVSYGSLLKPYQNAVRDAVLETCKQGLWGWEVTDIMVTFNFSQYDSVKSTPADFRDLTPMVLMEALAQSRTNLLEPFYKFELKVPQHVSGKALADLEKMRAEFDNVIALNGGLYIKGLVPVDTSKNYSIELASYTANKGVFATKFYGYKRAPDGFVKQRRKIRIDPLNKTKYLMYKSNAIRM